MKKLNDNEGYYFGTAKVGEKGQIVVPKEARDLFGIQPGNTVVIVGDAAKGLYIVKSSKIKEFALTALSNMGIMKDKTKETN